MTVHLEDLDKTFGPLTMWDHIVIMHEHYGLRAPSTPRQLDQETHDYRVKFLHEELQEYIEAETLEDKIDALVDLVVVAMGTAHMHGFDWSSHWNEVHRANMQKERCTDASQSKRGSALDLIKPEGWVGPSHSQFL